MVVRQPRGGARADVSGRRGRRRARGGPDGVVREARGGGRASRAGGRPFCFRVISPAASLTLQAESEAEAAAWIADLQGVIAELISMGPERNPSFRELDARGDPPG